VLPHTPRDDEAAAAAWRPAVRASRFRAGCFRDTWAMAEIDRPGWALEPLRLTGRGLNMAGKTPLPTPGTESPMDPALAQPLGVGLTPIQSLE
jgi:hypothetical protein